MLPFPFTSVDAACVRHPADRAPRPAPRAAGERLLRALAALLLGAVCAVAVGSLASAATPRLLAAATPGAGAAGPDHAHPGVSTCPAQARDAGAADKSPGAPATDDLPATTEDAAAQLSGSQWPGVINHLLQRPLPGTTADPQGPEIHIDYPSFGVPAVDADIRAWVSGIANAFTTHLALSRNDVPEELVPLHDPMEADGAPDQRPTFELWGSYSISRPSDAAVSITFEIWNYAGTAQGNLDILTLNYSLITGQRLAFMDLFEKPETALALMSEWSRKELAPRLGASMRMRMLDDGTAPLVENFSSLTLTPQGICINFQPYQVAPWAAGVQKVEMPLEALLPAGPLLALWGR